MITGDSAGLFVRFRVQFTPDSNKFLLQILERFTVKLHITGSVGDAGLHSAPVLELVLPVVFNCLLGRRTVHGRLVSCLKLRFSGLDGLQSSR